MPIQIHKQEEMLMLLLLLLALVNGLMRKLYPFPPAGFTILRS